MTSSRCLPLCSLLLAFSFSPACAPDPGIAPLELEEGCQPLLAGKDCLLPYPSDFFLVDDPLTPSGHAIDVTGYAESRTKENLNADVTDFRKLDGFSKFNPIVALLGSPIDPSGLVSIDDDPRLSTSPESKTLLIDTETGEFIPHYVDVDPREEDPELRALTLRSYVGLKAERRYVVALQNVLGPDGAWAKTPEGFRRHRDRVVVDDEAFIKQNERFERDVFRTLEVAKIPRHSLQLAWDFTTGSDENVYRDMLIAREKTMEWLNNNTPTVTAEIAEIQSRHTFRAIKGTITGPSFLENDEPGAQLFRNAAGEVVQNGTFTFEYTAIIPKSVAERYSPSEIAFLGHGFFGRQTEAEYSGSAGIFNQTETIGFAIDWIGMSTPDVGVTAETIGGRVADAPEFSDRLVQAMMNWLVLSAAIEGPLKDQAVFHRPDEGEGSTVPEALFYDDQRFHMVGLSLGHVLGTVLTALHPKIERSVLQVGGAGLANMIFRAKPFNAFLLLMDLSLENKLEQQKLSATLQRHLDRFDPAFWNRFVLDDELPIGPSSNPSRRRVLMQMGIGDTSVPNVSSEFQARELGIPLLSPSPKSVYGLDRVTGIDGSGLAVFDFGVDDSFSSVASPSEVETYSHIGMRYHHETREQMRLFFEQGIIVNLCDGVCSLTPLF